MNTNFLKHCAPNTDPIEAALTDEASTPTPAPAPEAPVVPTPAPEVPTDPVAAFVAKEKAKQPAPTPVHTETPVESNVNDKVLQSMESLLKRVELLEAEKKAEEEKYKRTFLEKELPKGLDSDQKAFAEFKVQQSIAGGKSFEDAVAETREYVRKTFNPRLIDIPQTGFVPSSVAPSQAAQALMPSDALTSWLESTSKPTGKEKVKEDSFKLF